MTTISNAIYAATNTSVNSNDVIDEIREAISSAAMDNGKQWVTGQDDALCRWEYYVDYNREDELDEDGELIQSDETITLLSIHILPRSASSAFVKADNPVGVEITVDVNIEL